MALELVSIEQLRFQVRADADEGDDLLTLFGEAAEKACKRLCNRNLYVDDTALQDAIEALPAAMAAASEAYDSAMDAAASIDDERERDTAEKIAEKALSNAQLNQFYTLNGMVLTADLQAAILLAATDFYEKRAAGDVPQGARHVCELNRYNGD